MPDKAVNNYNALIAEIGNLLAEGRRKSFQQLNTILVETYWNIGRRIVEHEQQGNEKAEYGSRLLKDLARDLSIQYGRGLAAPICNVCDYFIWLIQNARHCLAN